MGFPALELVSRAIAPECMPRLDPQCVWRAGDGAAMHGHAIGIST